MSQRVKQVAVAITVFSTVFVLCMVIWLNVKPFYAEKMVCLGSRIAAFVADAKVLDCKKVEKGIEVKMTWFTPALNGIREVEYSDTLFTDRYTFNVPLTLSMLAAIMTLISLPWRSILEGLTLICAGHLIWIVSFLLVHLKTFILQHPQGQIIHEPSMALQFLWQFSDNMLIRFEPFIIPAVLWMAHMGAGYIQTRKG